MNATVMAAAARAAADPLARAQAHHVGAILPGLRAARKSIDPKYFYDRRGSELFERITQTDEYYLTRAEHEIFARHAGAIAAMIGPQCMLIEPGAGNCEKVEHLLPALRPSVYLPVDISGAHLRQAAMRLGRRHPWLHCMPLAAEFDRLTDLPALLAPARRAVFFPGSTIGNFEPEHAIGFLRVVRRLADVEGGLLIGVDLEKDRRQLEAAYNDRAGITARFNLNLLEHVNRLTGSDFRSDRFRHLARYDARSKRIEMYLCSRCAQRVTMGGEVIEFARGEWLHTENSYKYSTAAFAALAAEAGFVRARTWRDSARRFALHYFVAA